MSLYRYDYTATGIAEYRLPLTFENTSGGSGNATFSLAGIADIDAFFNNVQTNGYDIRVVQADGRTIISATAWDIQSWNKTSRTGTIRIQGLTMAAGMSLYWLVWGKDGDDATSAWVGSPTPTSPKTVHLHRGNPTSVEAARLVLSGAGSGQAKAATPRHTFHKSPDSTLRIYFKIDNIKRSGVTASAGSDRWDNPSYGTHEVVDGNDADVATMYTVTDGRFAVDDKGDLYYSMLVKAGTTGTSYTARATITTVDGEVQIYTAGIVVKTVLAT